MKLYLKLFILAFLAGLTTSAQEYTLTGKITDTKGTAIPFASIYINTTTKGTSSNVEGNYKLTLPAKKIDLLFTAIGYDNKVESITLKSNTTINIILTPKVFMLEDVIIGRSNEDPANEIIKKVIAKRETYLNEVESFSCQVYTKGMQRLLSAPKKFLGRDIAKTLELDSNRKGIIYLSETESKLDFKRKTKIKELMISSKIAGNDNGFSFNKASDLSINFYNNVLLEDKLNVRGFISPIANNAFSYYKYKFLGSSQNSNGETVSKIQVTPKKTYDPAFSGIIYIINDSWRLSSVNLFLTKKAGIEFIDTLRIKQQLMQVNDIYLPSSVNFELRGKVMNFAFSGYVIGVYSNYNVEPIYGKHFFTNEILRIDKSSNKKDSLYWDKSRPTPLTTEERDNYNHKDSISNLKASKKYLDSFDRVKNKFNPVQILITPYIYYSSYNKKSITYDPLISSIFYNTVEGFALKYAINLKQGFEDGRYYSVKPSIRYGFSNKHFNGNILAKYLYNPQQNAFVSIGFGTEVADLNKLKNPNLFRNSLNALLFGKNLSKFYERRFINIQASREFAPSFELKVEVDYAKRISLLNSSLYTFNKTDKFTSNNPFEPLDELSYQFPQYNGLVVSGTLAYTFAQKYITRPDGRLYVESKFPKVEFNYKKGISGIFNSTVDYDFISLELYQKDVHYLLLGKSSLFIGAGKFLTIKNLNYPDWKHFRANSTIVFDANIKNFHFLDFYLFNTTKQYFEAHFQHNFGSFFINKIPLIRKLKLEEIVGGAYLSSPEKRNYSEFYFGFRRLNFRIDYGYAYDRNILIEKGFKLSYGIIL